MAALTPLLASLGLPFVTVDLARRDDDTWRVIELGDGQVSDRPASHDLLLALAQSRVEPRNARFSPNPPTQRATNSEVRRGPAS